MENNKMYLTTAEAKAKGLGSVQEQIDRYNAALTNRTDQEAEILVRLARQGVHPTEMEARLQIELAKERVQPVEDLGACFERNIARVILGGR